MEHRRRPTCMLNPNAAEAGRTLSSGASIEAPKPLKAALRRLRIRSRHVSRKIEAAKVQDGFAPKARLPKGTRLPVSNSRKKSAAILAKLHSRIANVRADFTHKLTTRLCRESQAAGIEDLNVKGMSANDAGTAGARLSALRTHDNTTRSLAVEKSVSPRKPNSILQ